MRQILTLAAIVLCAAPSARRRRQDRGERCGEEATKPPSASAAGRCRADADRPVRHLGRLHRIAQRQEGLLCAGQAGIVEDQPAEPAARSGLCLRLDPPGGEGQQRSLDHDRLSRSSRARNRRSRSAAQPMRCTPRATGSGSRMPPRRSGWSRPCASRPMSVKGVSAKGTETTDSFSLKGLAQALDKLAQDCRR